MLKLDDFIPYRLSFTSNLVSDVIASAYEAMFGLTIPQWRLIAVIAENDGITQASVGARTRMDKVVVSRAAIALVGRALIARRPNADDRRSHCLVLTPDGHALYAQIVPKALRLEAQIFGGFTTAEIADFLALLARIEQATLAIDADGAAGSISRPS